MKLHRKKLSLAVAQAIRAGFVVGLAVPAAYAQQTPATPESDRIRMEITGTRLPSPNLESTSPVSVISSKDIKIENPTSTENLLNSLPQVMAEFGGNMANGATGTATVDLRGLGSDRTLVLINGRRLPAGSPTLYATDLNQIPTQLIQRVEILTGGASAVYGSDAVAGVVNFIMNDRFEGVQLDVGYSLYNHQQDHALANVIRARAATNPAQFAVPGDVDSDGEVSDYSMILGGNFAGGKGNAVVFLGYKKTKAVLQRDRDFSACATGSNSAGFTCAGSGTAADGQFISDLLGEAQSFTVANNQGGVRPFTADDQFNFAPYNYYQRPDERYTVQAYAHYDIVPQARVYTEFQFHDSHTLAQIAPSGVFGDQFTISQNNPLLSADWRNVLFGPTNTTPGDVLILRRNVEGGGRVDDLRHTSYRGVVGIKGDILTNWDYDLFYQLGKVVYQETYKNDFSKTRTRRALDVVADPDTGEAVCASVLDGTDPNCVPYNVWTLGGVTPGALAYLQTPGFQKGETYQEVIGGTLRSDLGNYGWRTPWAKSGVGLAVGLERRVEKLTFDTDTAFSTDDLSGQGGATVGLSGKYDVKEYFAEIRIPLVEDRPWMKLLSVNGSYRYADYSTGKTTNTFGVGAEWAPVSAVRLRGSYQEATRHANIIELFEPQTFNLFDMNEGDPCGGPTPSATLDQCLRTGLAASQYGSPLLTNPAGQYNFLDGGNANLDPEEAKSYTVGVVLTPMRNLSASIDYFDIKVDKVIDIIPSDLAIRQCLESGQFCELIHRDANGTLWLPAGGFVTGTQLNLAKRKTAGVDVTADYTHSLGSWGSLGFNFIGTWLKEFITEPVPGLGEYDCAGLFGTTCGVPAPEWRHRLRASWSTPWNVDLALTWRHSDSVDLDSTSSNPLLSASSNPIDRTLGQRDYIDLAGSWAITKNFTLWAGVNNLFDRDPPIVNSNIAGPSVFGNGNTWPQVYDSLGRRIFVTLTAKF